MTSWQKHIIRKQKVKVLGKEQVRGLGNRNTALTVSSVIFLSSPGCTEVPAARSNMVSSCHRDTWTLRLHACLAPRQAAQSFKQRLRGPVTATCSSQPPLLTTSLSLWAQHDTFLHWMASLLAILWHFLWLNKSNLLAQALNKGRHLWRAAQWLPKSVQALISRPCKYVTFHGKGLCRWNRG